MILKYFTPGITKLRFKPAYNPYTEPSMEVFSYHEGKTLQMKWYVTVYVCYMLRLCMFTFKVQLLSLS